ncbi:hypothetical protein WOLCODRAFT_149875 [Wolfiporia cocos MD-104 SS10]|uniref:Uncharacterized protein n=1 Tax=Wolfiporia cocos (strain MD-104) TaxID=742152 RepID=A0A2H3JE56_WOLCO|nr:hypothetical protein WOLCODRAFT_149875 [Wolfiporia cocos MD-104 SS10]
MIGSEDLRYQPMALPTIGSAKKAAARSVRRKESAKSTELPPGRKEPGKRN